MRTKYGREVSAQERADHATGNIIEAIRTLVHALDDAVLAMMYYMPAKFSKPDEALKRLDRVKESFARVFYLIETVPKPVSPTELATLKKLHRSRLRARK